jgi:molecular chaperone GrpE
MDIRRKDLVLKDNSKTGKKNADSSSDDKKMKEKKTKNTDQLPAQDEAETIEALQSELAAEKDRMLRMAAEVENFKKRKQKEIDDFRKFANETVFRQLLTVVDNLERAINSAEECNCTVTTQDLLEGVKLTHKEILRIFESFQVKPIDAEKKPFDPNFHQAVTQTETDKYPENTVTTELQKGYLLNDRLLRPSMVVVSKNADNTKKDNE